MSVTRTVPHARWREYRSNTKADQSMERVGAVITQPVSHSHVVPRHSPWNEQSCEHAVSTAGPATAAPGVKLSPLRFVLRPRENLPRIRGRHSLHILSI